MKDEDKNIGIAIKKTAIILSVLALLTGGCRQAANKQVMTNENVADTVTTLNNIDLAGTLDLSKNSSMININSSLNKEQFESIVQFILENGKAELYSQLWGYSPYITFGCNYAIYLCPDVQSLRFPQPENVKEWCDISNWIEMSVNIGGITWLDISLIENNVYITGIINMDNNIGYDEYKNRLITTIIPQIKLFCEK